MREFLSAIAFLMAAMVCQAEPLSPARPEAVGMSSNRLERIHRVVEAAIKDGKLPGAVVLVVRQNRIVFHKAYGHRAMTPKREAMTLDTIFDLASLTKPLATATSVMKLLEIGKIRLNDPVARYLPKFGQNRKHRITIKHLMTHTSGLIADNALRDYRDGRKRAMERIFALTPIAAPGARFIYSDVGYIVLGHLVEKISGERLDVFSRKRIFEPLGMRETMFRPTLGRAQRTAPTEKVGETWLRGVVHDPRAREMDGVAGHAGLFSTAADLARYAQMILNQGHFHQKWILNPAAVSLMTTPQDVPGGKRGLGWDIDTRYSSNRGELFPVGGVGHTGFTGTSIWIDPSSETAVIFLSHRVHPTGKGSVVRLRGQVATLVAASIVKPPFPGIAQPLGLKRIGKVLTGIDVLKRDSFRALRGHKVGLVTNHTGIDREGATTIDLLHTAKEVDLVALFSPEHGIRGKLDKAVDDSKDTKTGLPIYSLYGKRKRPAQEQLKGIDMLVFDIQDIGCRFYTYISTMGNILEVAAEKKIKVIILDRPNPINGLTVSGPVLDPRMESFTGYHPIPVRHGMTMGELGVMFNRERKIGANLGVIRMEGWHRADYFDSTGLLWTNPSPNMRSLNEALLYPGIGLLETTNISVGRGTDRPFEIIGAPWIDGRKLVTALMKKDLPGLRIVPTKFTPTASVHADKECGGAHLFIDDWRAFQPLKTGITIATVLKKLYPREWKSKGYLRLLANPKVHNALEGGATPAQLEQLWQSGLREHLKIRQQYLLYR